MGERDDILGLSLSLSLGGCGMVNPLHHLKVNHMQKPPQSSPMKHKSSLNDLSQLPDRSSDMRSFLGGIDVNSSPTVAVAADCDNENGTSSPNSTVSSISGGKQSDGDHNEAAVRASCSRGSDDEDGGERKKLRLTKEQAKVLEETFKEYNTLTPKRKQALAQELNLRPRQVEVWFQNRRARTKLKQTEVDCEYLKRCCENLTEENKRLQKEVQELRTLKLSSHFSMHMNPPTTLTMCPSCERVAVSSASSSSTSQSAVRPSNPSLLDLSIRQPGHVKPKPFEGSIFRP